MKNSLINRKTIASFICLCSMALGCLMTPISSAIETEEDIITVGIPADRCPMFYINIDSGKLTGIGVDIMIEAAKEAGYTAKFRVISEKNLKEALDNPEYDIVMPVGSAISSGTGRDSIISNSLLQTPFTLVTTSKTDLPPIDTMTVGMLSSLGGGAETVGTLYPGITIVFFDTMKESVSALRSGKVDALLHNSYVWSYILQKPSYS